MKTALGVLIVIAACTCCWPSPSRRGPAAWRPPSVSRRAFGNLPVYPRDGGVAAARDRRRRDAPLLGRRRELHGRPRSGAHRAQGRHRGRDDPGLEPGGPARRRRRRHAPLLVRRHRARRARRAPMPRDERHEGHGPGAGLRRERALHHLTHRAQHLPRGRPRAGRRRPVPRLRPEDRGQGLDERRRPGPLRRHRGQRLRGLPGQRARPPRRLLRQISRQWNH